MTPVAGTNRLRKLLSLANVIWRRLQGGTGQGTGHEGKGQWQAIGALTSMVLHAVALIALAYATFTRPSFGPGPAAIVAVQTSELPTVDSLAPSHGDGSQDGAMLQGESGAAPLSDWLQSTADQPAEALHGDRDLALPTAATERSPIGLEVGGQEGSGLLTRLDRGGLGGRGTEARGQLAAGGGGTPQSKDAVERGLRWLAAHQRDDGSWHFDHRGGLCDNLCRDPGKHASTTASTALALLAFLGHGQTHREGEYQDAVERGLYYLCGRMLITPRGGDLQEGTMYAQGLATIALTEAHAMTQDQALADYAQRAIDFIVSAQNYEDGGWRYVPGQPGDATVTAWQVMALKSGQMAYLRVPPRTLLAADNFLDRISEDDGAAYKYQPDKPADLTCTSIGLLLRMYAGWDKERPALARGVAALAAAGPSADNMYYNYYATQVMHHWGGEEWRLWNYRLRDFLIATQADSGHESGSWYFAGGQGHVGGRLYNTAMAIMTLEVYYRHLPIYDSQALHEW